MAASTLVGVINDPEHRWFGYMTFDDSAWEEYRGVLAARLSADEFEAASQGVAVTRGIFTGIVSAPTWPERDWDPLPERTVNGLRSIHAEATAAYNALATLGGFRFEPGLLHEDKLTST